MTDSSSKLSEMAVTLTCEIVSAHVSNNKIAADEVPGLIGRVYEALTSLGQQIPMEDAAPKPAVSVRASIRPDYIVCLEDGKKLTMLRGRFERG